MSPDRESVDREPVDREPDDLAPADREPDLGGGGLFTSLFTSDVVAAETSGRAWLVALLDAEAALARAEAACGVVTGEVATAVEAVCREGARSFDPVELGRRARLGGNPVVPLVASLRAALPDAVAPFVHYGATSQDVLDTALMLVSKRVLSLVETDLSAAVSAAVGLADRHRDTLHVARTLLQPALPTTFGLRAAGWADALMDSADRLGELSATLPAQLGGAAGTLASLGAAGVDVRRHFAAEVGLTLTDIPWHSQRFVVGELGATLALTCGTCAKVARDVLLLSMGEVAEVREPAAAGRGQSSSMPHKRNPVLSAIVVANGRRAPALAGTLIGGLDSELDRSPGTWQAEWTTVDELLRAAGGSARSVAELLAGLEVDADAMARHLADLAGLLMAEHMTAVLAARVGHVAARQMVDRAVGTAAEGGRFDAALTAEVEAEASGDARLAGLDVAAALDPRGHLGSAEAFIDAVLARSRGRRPGGT